MRQFFSSPFQEKVAALIEAVDESIIDCFTLRPSNPLLSGYVIDGQVKTSNKDFIFVQITENEHCNYISYHPDRCYDIFFHVNRTTFQVNVQLQLNNVDRKQIHVNFIDIYDCPFFFINDISNFSCNTMHWNGFRTISYSICSSIVQNMKITNGIWILITHHLPRSTTVSGNKLTILNNIVILYFYHESNTFLISIEFPLKKLFDFTVENWHQN